MGQHEKKTIILVAIMVTCFATTSLYAATQSTGLKKVPQQNDDVNKDTQSKVDKSPLAVIVDFGDKTINESIAEEMASSEGFKYIRMFNCAEQGKDDCLAIVVEGKKKKFFEYFLSPEPCQVDFIRGTKDPKTGKASTKIKVTEKNKAFKSDTRCFAGYQVRFRARSRNVLLTGGSGSLLVNDLTAQLSFDGKWLRALQIITSKFYGQHGSGWTELSTYEFLDSNKRLLASEIVPLYATPQDSSIKGSIDARCEYYGKKVELNKDFRNSWIQTSCNTLVPDQVTVIVEGKGEPGGVGGGASIELGLDIDICEDVARSGEHFNERAGVQATLHCLANPGHYFPDLKPNETTLDISDDFLGGVPELLGSYVPLHCPPFYWNRYSLDVAGGKANVTADVKFECKERDGACHCTKTDEIRDIDIVITD